MNLQELKQDENRITLLRIEFDDLWYSDKDFNYSKDEFEEWLKDLVFEIEKENNNVA
jgi:hypothetical protein